MKVRSVLNVGSHIEISPANREKLVLQKGEVLQAKVISRNGQNIMLRTSEGKTINGKMFVDMTLSEGDRVELIVTGNSGQLSMQVLSIESERLLNPMADPLLMSLGLQGDAQANAVMRLIRRLAVKPSAEQIASAIALLKKNPSLDVKTALFFAANDIPATQENIDTLSALVSEQKSVGRQLAEIALETTAGDPGDPPANTGAMPDEPEQADAGRQEPALRILPDVAADVEQTTALPYNMKTEDGLAAVKELSVKLLSLFIKPEQHGDMGKASSDMLGELAVLNGVIQNIELKEKADAFHRVEQLFRETKLISEMNRFACILVPFKLDQQYETAELYFFKPRKKSGLKDRENVIIHIGLNTQNIGRVETTVRIERKNVSLLFYLEDDNIMRALQDQSAEMQKSIRKIGYSIKDIRVQRLLERTTVANADLVLAAASGNTPSMVDYRI